jgi:hypothetical protein
MHAPERVKSFIDLTPRVETLISLRLPVVFVTLLGFIPLGIFSAFATEDATYRGIPATWLPFMMLNVAWMAGLDLCPKREDVQKAFFACRRLGSFLFVGPDNYFPKTDR